MLAPCGVRLAANGSALAIRRSYACLCDGVSGTSVRPQPVRIGCPSDPLLCVTHRQVGKRRLLGSIRPVQHHGCSLTASERSSSPLAIVTNDTRPASRSPHRRRWAPDPGNLAMNTHVGLLALQVGGSPGLARVPGPNNARAAESDLCGRPPHLSWPSIISI
jgi:hypothetical protein